MRTVQARTHVCASSVRACVQACQPEENAYVHAVVRFWVCSMAPACGFLPCAHVRACVRIARFFANVVYKCACACLRACNARACLCVFLLRTRACLCCVHVWCCALCTSVRMPISGRAYVLGLQLNCARLRACACMQLHGCALARCIPVCMCLFACAMRMRACLCVFRLRACVC
jgi:hypothetical protein